jgi:hypothetical protein
MSDYAKEHYHFEYSRRLEINGQLRANLQLALGGIGFLVLIGKGVEPVEFLYILSYWLAFTLLSFSIAFTAFATLYYPTRFLDPPEIIEKYRKDLIEHDADTADKNLQDFMSERWIDNASENAKRNRGRSKFNLLSRLLIVAAAFPLLLIAILSVKVPFL